jgi:hypothetical protein
MALIRELKELHSTHGDYCTNCKMVDCPTLKIIAKYDIPRDHPAILVEEL